MRAASFSITPFDGSPAAYQAVAELVARAPESELVDFEYPDPAEQQAFDASLAAADTPVTRIVARAPDGAVLGFAHVFRVPWTSRPAHYWCVARVDRPARRRGIGRALLSELRAVVQQAGGRTLAIAVRTGDPGLLEAGLRQGCYEAFRSIEFALDPRSFDATRFAESQKRFALQGIRIVALPQLQADDPAWLSKLHALYTLLVRDVPIPERATIAPAQFEEFLTRHPMALPGACFVAVEDGRFLGISFLHRAIGAPVLYQKLTGVLAEARGRGLALALKLATIAFAHEHGYERIVTWIETNNPAMLALSDKLGFQQQQGGIVVFEQRLEPRDER